jgi:AraC-like DNA-binding protein
VVKRPLRDGRDDLGTIARSVGFSDASHLSRQFRRHTGSPPGACRRRSG